MKAQCGEVEEREEKLSSLSVSHVVFLLSLSFFYPPSSPGRCRVSE